MIETRRGLFLDIESYNASHKSFDVSISEESALSYLFKYNKDLFCKANDKLYIHREIDRTYYVKLYFNLINKEGINE